MKNLILGSVFLLAVTFSDSQSFEVLFIGNSYTYTNNLPEMLRELALSNGDTLIYDSYTPGGYTFELHSSDPNTIAKIKERKWDFVILQEQSQRPSFPPSQVAVEVYPYAILLDSMINANHKCTETVFFMTWGRKYGDQLNCPFYPPVCTFAGMQQRLRESYLEMGNILSATVAPAGIAWKYSMEADSNVNLYLNDNSHPSIAGSYLTACVFYSVLFQKNPLGSTYISTLNPTTASFLQNIAASTVMDSLSTWNINVNMPKADFYVSVNNNKVDFTNTSYKANQYNWDFGDGTSDTVSDPVHTYMNTGNYLISLKASSDCASDIKFDTVEIVTTTLDEFYDINSIDIYPNPAGDLIYLKFIQNSSREFEISIIDLLGKILFEEVIKDIDKGETYKIDTGKFPTGIYYMLLNSHNNNHSEMIIIN